MPHFTVRPAKDSDIPTLINMGREFHKNSNFSDLEFDPLFIDAHFRRLMSRDACCLLIAVDSSRTIGFISGSASGAMFGPDTIASEDLFYVEPDMRGAKSGVSTELLRAFCHWAADQGAARISIANSAGTDDDKFQRLLETYGFQKAGSVMYVEIG